jgi:hypothetical protein
MFVPIEEAPFGSAAINLEGCPVWLRQRAPSLGQALASCRAIPANFDILAIHRERRNLISRVCVFLDVLVERLPSVPRSYAFG